MKVKGVIIMEEGLTFDDILLVPRKSNVLPSEVELRTRLTKDIHLNIPLMSAAMDTVTEHKLAIKLALEGGMGIIHKNMSIGAQADEVRMVKRFENGFIVDPVTILPTESILSLDSLIKKTGFSHIPIIDHSRKLLGMVTSRDYSMQKHSELSVKDRMVYFRDLVTAEKGVSLEKANDLLIESRKGTLLVVDKKQRLVS
ncbi:IMP dehydrogenase, partial [Nanoarchaeota archaeon]